MIRRALPAILVVMLVWFVSSRPHQAATDVKQLGTVTSTKVDGFMTFLDQLTK